jgi:hypothetical protein
LNTQLHPSFVVTLFAATCAFALSPLFAQQSNSGSHPNSNNQTGVRVEKFNVKQEFGPQTTSRRGDRMSATSPKQSKGGNGAGQSAEKYKQDFGPQQASRRGDRMSVVTPSGQNNGSGAPGASGLNSASSPQSGTLIRRKRKQPSNRGRSDDAHFNPIATAGTQESAGSGAPQSGFNSPSSH